MEKNALLGKRKNSSYNHAYQLAQGQEYFFCYRIKLIIVN